MKFSMFTSGFMRHSLERAFAEARRIGYDGIEIWGGRPHAFPLDLDDRAVERIRTLSRDHAMPIVAYTPETNGYPYNLMFTEPRMHADAVSLVKRAIEAGHALGAPMTVISFAHAGWEIDPDDAWKHLTDTLADLAAHAEQVGTALALEPLTPYESNMICGVGDLLRALRQVPSPNLKAVIDLVPHFVLREPLEDVLRLVGDRLAHLHFIDGDGASDTHLIPGDGRMPLAQLAPRIEALGYEGFCTIEMVTAYINEPSLFAQLALERAKGILGR